LTGLPFNPSNRGLSSRVLAHGGDLENRADNAPLPQPGTPGSLMRQTRPIPVAGVHITQHEIGRKVARSVAREHKINAGDEATRFGVPQVEVRYLWIRQLMSDHIVHQLFAYPIT
jgi:hypothetical protein